MQEWYVNYYPHAGARDWDDARDFGFVSAGYGVIYSQPFRRLKNGDRVWVYWTQRGSSRVGRYVGRGIVVSDPVPAYDATFTINGNERPFPSLAGALRGEYFAQDGNPDNAEWVARVRWELTLSVEDGVPYSQIGFANQNTTVHLKPERPDHAEILRRLQLHLPAEDLSSGPTAASDETGEATEDAALELATLETAGQGHSVDPRAVELAAVEAVTSYFRARSWGVANVGSQKLGWDLTVTRPGKRWLVEVKGTTGGLPTVLLTANELVAARDRAEWCLAVVTRALSSPSDPPAFYGGDVALALSEPVVLRARLSGERASPHPVAAGPAPAQADQP